MLARPFLRATLFLFTVAVHRIHAEDGFILAPSSSSSSCRLYDLDFDATPGVTTPEIRGLIPPENFYENVGIARMHCSRNGHARGVCRLFDTKEPVGRWGRSDDDDGTGVCSCEPSDCRPVNRCGDPDLSPTDVNLGNVLIVEERAPHQAASYPPDDCAAGGTITLEFSEPTMVMAMGFLDTETEVMIEFKHVTGSTHKIGPVTANNEYILHTAGVDQVSAVVIHLQGSGALASIQYKQGCPAEMVQCSQSGGDPHFTRWTAPHRNTFHGECDLVLLRSASFDEGAGLQVHARTTMESYFSYIESAAVMLGSHILEIHRDVAILNGVVYNYTSDADDDSAEPIPPLTFHSGPPPPAYPNTVYRYVLEQDKGKKRIYRLDLITYCLGKLHYSTLHFQFSGQFMTIRICGHVLDMGDAVGLLGRYFDGALVTRAAQDFADLFPASISSRGGGFADFAMEWQVDPTQGDPLLFTEPRNPQLPFEKCRIPTGPRPVRGLRARAATTGSVTLGQAHKACGKVTTHKIDHDLCVDDVLTTGDLDLAEIW